MEKGSGLDCWICYDSESQESGPLICPCDCKGDTAAVHHNCLRRWIVEVSKLSGLCVRGHFVFSRAKKNGR